MKRPRKFNQSNAIYGTHKHKIKGLVSSSSLKIYLFITIDECSRFPFAFPRKDMTTTTVIKCLDQLFTLFGTASFALSDNASSFSFLKFKAYLEQREISTSKCNVYHPSKNGKADKTVQTVRKTSRLALKTVELPHEQWEIVFPEALNSIKLFCTATNTTPHERFFSFQRRSSVGPSFPGWLTCPGAKAFLR